MEKNIAVIWGDCSSPEIVKQTIRVLDKVAEKYGHTFHYTDAAMGGEAIDKYGDPLPQHELDKCLAADSVLLGAVGGPKWEGLPGEQRPEKGLLRLRAGMGLYSNNRPAKIWPQLAPASPLKPEIVAQASTSSSCVSSSAACTSAITRPTRWKTARSRPSTPCPTPSTRSSASAASALRPLRSAARSCAAWTRQTCWTPAACGRSVMHRLQAEYPDVEYSEMFVDNCAMQIVKNPAQFDVIVTREHVRRHPVRRGFHDHRFHRHDPVLQPGATAPAACTSPSTAPPPTLPARTSSTPPPASCRLP